MKYNLISFKKFLLTSAFPYSNGTLHLGHILENVQVDIFSRYNKLIGNIVYFISSDDSHGTPIMLKSKELNINPKILIKSIYKNHKKDFKKFYIKHDYYGKTDDKNNYIMLLKIYNIFKKKKLIFKKKINQLFDNKYKMFLPDRMILGTCPKCFSKNQYGDNCNNCNNVYNAIDLINPKSVLSNNILEIKKSEHFFLNIEKLKYKIKFIIENVINLQKPVIKKSLEWFKFKIISWNISRDPPYFGFKIPNSKKYFYVWLDATTGYISSFKKFCKFKKLNYIEYWKNNYNTELYQFIGKDIIYFHVFFWPIILDIINFKKPNKIIVHGHLKIKNKKMSKSSFNYINARKFLKHIEADYVRYYFASKLSKNINDINFNSEEFINKINKNLINKILNIASRSSKLINKYNNGYMSNDFIYKSPYNIFTNYYSIIKYFYENFEYNNIILTVEKLSNIANKYITNKKPWFYDDEKYIQNVSSIGIYLYKIIIFYIKPIIPKISKFSEKFLNIKINKNNFNKLFSKKHKINVFKNVFKKININDF